MVDIVRRMQWSYISIIYEESNYGIKVSASLEWSMCNYASQTAGCSML